MLAKTARQLKAARARVSSHTKEQASCAWHQPSLSEFQGTVTWAHLLNLGIDAINSTEPLPCERLRIRCCKWRRFYLIRVLIDRDDNYGKSDATLLALRSLYHINARRKSYSLGVVENWPSFVQKIVHTKFQTILHDPPEGPVVVKNHVVNQERIIRT